MLRIKSFLSQTEFKRHLPYLAALIALLFLYAGRHWLKWNGFILGTWDEANWMPVAMRSLDSTLFENDFTVRTIERYFPPAYIFILAMGYKILGSLRLLFLSGSSILLLIYSVGIYWLGWKIFRHRLAALVIAVISFRVNMDLGGAGWGIYMPHIQPRTIFFAAIPWLVNAFLHLRGGPIPLFFFGWAVGLLGNIHPVSAVHLYLMTCGAVLIWPFSKNRFREILVATAGFTVGIFPYLAQWIIQQDGSHLSWEIVLFRTGKTISPSFGTLLHRITVSFFPPIIFAALGWMSIKESSEKQKVLWIIRLCCAAAVLAAMGPIQSFLIPRLFALHFLRMSGYLFLFSLLLVGFLLRGLFDRKSVKIRAAAVMLSLFFVATAGGGRIGELAKHIIPSSKTNKKSVFSAHVKVPRTGFPDQKSLLDLAEWAKNNTSPSDLFLTPKGAWASFRLYAQRPVFVTFKDGAVAMFSGEKAEEWHKRYWERNRIYETSDIEEILQFADQNNIRYMIFTHEMPAIDLPTAYQNQKYRICRFPSSPPI